MRRQVIRDAFIKRYGRDINVFCDVPKNVISSLDVQLRQQPVQLTSPTAPLPVPISTIPVHLTGFPFPPKPENSRDSPETLRNSAMLKDKVNYLAYRRTRRNLLIQLELNNKGKYSDSDSDNEINSMGPLFTNRLKVEAPVCKDDEFELVEIEPPVEAFEFQLGQKPHIFKRPASKHISFS